MNDILSALYMIAFALCGIFIARPIFRKDDPLRRLFFGLVFGLVMLIWLPTLFAFFLNFTLAAQYAALAAALVGAAVATFIANGKHFRENFKKFGKGEFKKAFVPLLITAVPLVFICFVLHIGHTIVEASNGSLHVGQCTYGDLCMHLGFISSISVQQNFPPEYSLLPGTPLGYPFLCDSVSSTFYTLGASLRISALLPALYACFVTVLGVYFFFDTWFKKHATAVLASYVFFIGGGFGFWYFFNNKLLLQADGIDRMKELMTGFYKMPTNLPSEGLRWVNSIADMLLPQRATLFGWSLLFPALQLLYRGAIDKENRVFIPLGIIAGSMPLVHTHSFLGLGIISAFLFIALLLDLLNKRNGRSECRLAVQLIGCFIGMLLFSALRLLPIRVQQEGADLIATSSGCLALTVLALVISAVAAVKAIVKKQNFGVPVLLAGVSLIAGAATIYFVRTGSMLMLIAPLAGALICLAVALFVKGTKDDTAADEACTAENGATEDPAEERKKALAAAGKNILFFAIFGVITLLLACPQLFGFTLKQSGNSDSFLRWQLNWDNNSDSWLWFYIKNLGLIFILLVPGFLYLKKKDKLFCGGGIMIWIIAEILLFQPNPYDNNKLLFVWFTLTCGITANLLIETLAKPAVRENGSIDGAKTAARFALLVTAFAALFTSGIMTLAREYNSADHYGIVTEADGTKHIGLIESGYEVTPSYMVEMTEWVKANTEPDAVFLTQNNHNNAIAMLTGRSIFCGSGTFLHWHGVDYRPRQALIDDMYEHPAENLARFAAEYGIDYVLVSPYETGNYNVDSAWFADNLELVFSNTNVKLYKVAAANANTVNGSDQGNEPGGHR